MGFSKKTFGPIIGLDIGGTKMEGILWQGGKILETKTISAPKNSRQFWKQAFDLVSNLKLSKKITGIGIGIAGAIDFKKGIILNSPNLRFLNGVAVAAKFQNRFRIPVRMDNDANCFLLAEVYFGQARGLKHVVGLTLGTGVGGGVVIDGKLVRGTTGAAGELGQMIISQKGEKFLTVEDLVSGHGFQRLGVGDPKSLLKSVSKVKAKKVLQTVGKYLGIALANYVNIFDPQLFVLGGGISKFGERLLAPAREEMKKHTLLPAKFLPKVKVSNLKHPGALGAITLFW